MSAFAKGDRVRLSAAGRQLMPRNAKRHPDRVGRIHHVRSDDCCVVWWDGLTAYDSFALAPTALELANEGGR